MRRGDGVGDVLEDYAAAYDADHSAQSRLYVRRFFHGYQQPDDGVYQGYGLYQYRDGLRFKHGLDLLPVYFPAARPCVCVYPPTDYLYRRKISCKEVSASCCRTR